MMMGLLSLETQEEMPLTSRSMTRLQSAHKHLSPLRLCANCVPLWTTKGLLRLGTSGWLIGNPSMVTIAALPPSDRAPPATTS